MMKVHNEGHDQRQLISAFTDNRDQLPTKTWFVHMVSVSVCLLLHVSYLFWCELVRI